MRYDDGNQTLVKTATGIWSVEYNAENRPIRFTSSDGSTVIECSYDYMGRRAVRKVTENGSITLHHRYLYRGYLQIACCDLTRSAHPCLWLLTWAPTQPIATRPLAIRKDGTWFAYGWDLTKNICEVFGSAGYIRTAYTYTPYGSVSASGDVTQPIRWSSEFFDTETALVYYNYRHYNPADGRWSGRDPYIDADSYKHLYVFANNRMYMNDILGLLSFSDSNISTCCKVKRLKAYAKDFSEKGGSLKDVANKTAKAYYSLAHAREKSRNNPRRHIVVEIRAEFEQMDAECCTIQQYVSVNGKTFKEDRDPQGTTYGSRSMPSKSSEREALEEDAYLYYSVLSQGDVFPDNERGEHYRSIDYPSTSSTNPKEKWTFKIIVVDTCKENKEVSSIFYSIDWS